MIILGLDPGTATTGYGVIRVKELKGERVKKKKPSIASSLHHSLTLIGYGEINTKANSYMPERLYKIYKEIRKVLTQYKPDKVALESLFFFKNQKTVMSVSQARGVIMMACESKKVPLLEYPPLRVKSIICQNGRADKKEMQDKIRKILKLKIIPKPDDAADALAVAICCSKNLE